MAIALRNPHPQPKLRSLKPWELGPFHRQLGTTARASLFTLGSSGLKWSSLGLMLVGISAPLVRAHGVQIRSQIRPTVEIQAVYASGEPMVNAQVQVYAPNQPNQPLKTGQTDAQGVYRFEPQASGAWEISVRQAGHGDVIVLPVDLKTPSTVTVAASGPTLWQQILIIGSVVWGCVGTALYFKGRNAKRGAS